MSRICQSPHILRTGNALNLRQATGNLLDKMVRHPPEQGFRAANGLQLGNDIQIDDVAGGDFQD